MKLAITVCSLVIFLLMPMAITAKMVKKGYVSSDKYAHIELIEGKPKRAYKKLEPIWASAYSMKGTIKKAKKQAYKMGADAIIDVKIGTGDEASGSAYGGFGYGYSSPKPILKGWGIKWK